MKKAMVLIVMLTLLVSSAWADSGVKYQTSHRTDAQMVYNAMSRCGYSDCWVCITVTNGTSDMDYYIGFDNQDAYGSFGAWCAAIMAAAAVSEESDWTSANVCVGFRDKLFVTPNSTARYMYNNFSSRTEEQWMSYLDARTTIIDR